MADRSTSGREPGYGALLQNNARRARVRFRRRPRKHCATGLQVEKGNPNAQRFSAPTVAGRCACPLTHASVPAARAEAKRGARRKWRAHSTAWASCRKVGNFAGGATVLLRAVRKTPATVRSGARSVPIEMVGRISVLSVLVYAIRVF